MRLRVAASTLTIAQASTAAQRIVDTITTHGLGPISVDEVIEILAANGLKGEPVSDLGVVRGLIQAQFSFIDYTQ